MPSILTNQLLDYEKFSSQERPAATTNSLINAKHCHEPAHPDNSFASEDKDHQSMESSKTANGASNRNSCYLTNVRNNLDINENKQLANR